MWNRSHGDHLSVFSLLSGNYHFLLPPGQVLLHLFPRYLLPHLCNVITEVLVVMLVNVVLAGRRDCEEIV